MSAPPPDETPTAEAVVRGLSIPQVRTALASLRAHWANHSPVCPIYGCVELPCGVTANEFAFYFTMGHHARRQHRKHEPDGAHGA